MAYLDILVPTFGRPEDETALLCAARLAAALQARAAALYAAPDPAAEFVWAGEGFIAPPSPEAIQAARDMQEAAEKRAQTMALSVEKKVGAPLGLSCICRQDSPSRAVIEFSALCDLFVFPADSCKAASPLGGAFEAALLRARAPVLLARGADLLGKPVCIAWDGGVEVGRAVRAALPILRKAAAVTILQAQSSVGDRARAGVDPNLLQSRLKAGGVEANVQFVDAVSGAGAAEKILGAADPNGVLIAGAYAHSRAQEFIFGGATRTFLSLGGPSLFLSH